MTTVRKRDPRLDAEYYVSGNTVRRNVPRNYPAQWEPTQWEPTQWEPATRRYGREEQVRTRRSESTRRVSAQPRNAAARPAQPMREVRPNQNTRRAEATRAYAQAEAQRIAREEQNMRTLQLHRQWQRAAAERRRREEEARIAAEELAEQRRRSEQRVRAFAAVLAIFLVLTGALGIYTLLNRYIAIDAMTVEQRSLQAQIEDQQKRLEELQVEVNKQSNIAQVQDYARESLNMDYAQKENIRAVVLPGQ